MSSLRPFTMLGIPPRAVRLAGQPSSFALSRVASVAATNAAQTESVITLNNNAQFCLLREKWAIKSSALVAQRDQTTVVAAEGGVFRVDVGEGARFLCDPHKVIGTLDVAHSRIVYNESRLDILRAWSTLAWRRTAAALRSTYSFAQHWLSKIPVPERLRSIELPRLPELPVTAKEYWSKLRKTSSRLYAAAAERSFEYTHPPRLEIKGPCSVLIKP